MASADRPSVLALAVRALGWAGDERDRAFFAWKHDHNPFGPSPAWVAERDGEIVGFRTLQRWELVRGSERLRMVRAVDTATHPSCQRQGIFRALTEAAIEGLVAEGVDAVFNLPNPTSLPGYLTMGWSEVGRPTLGVVLRAPWSTVRVARSRQAAEKWSEPVEVGDPATDLLRDLGAGGWRAPLGRWATPRGVEYLRWRYSFPPMHYRVVAVRGGACVFRVRRRGPSREVVLCEWLSAEPDARAVRRLVAAVRGDYVVGVGLTLTHHGALPFPRQGPILVWRPLSRPGVPALDDLAISLGDLELF